MSQRARCDRIVTSKVRVAWVPHRVSKSLALLRRNTRISEDELRLPVGVPANIFPNEFRLTVSGHGRVFHEYIRLIDHSIPSDHRKGESSLSESAVCARRAVIHQAHIATALRSCAGSDFCAKTSQHVCANRGPRGTSRLVTLRDKSFGELHTAREGEGP